MRKTIKKKLNSAAGFTLAETLLAVLIMLMVSGIVAGGIPAAKNAYEKVVRASNAEILLSTTVTTLRNELGTARNVVLGEEGSSGGGESGGEGSGGGESGTTGAETVITYYNETIGASSKIYLAGEGDTEPSGVIMYQRYAESDLSAGSTPIRLISKEASTGDLYVTYESVSYDKDSGVIMFHNLSVNRESGDTGLTVLETLSIRVISY